MVIQLEKVCFDYDARTPWASAALRHIDLGIGSGEFIGVAGTTGSGKSTLLQLFNGIIKPTAGTVSVLDVMIAAGEKAPKMRELRRRVGLVFQFPEQQMFEETVEKDICFGPMNFGASQEEAKQKALQAFVKMGLDPALLQRSPFQLSGGQMRKAAIASVLAMEPDILVLDEPTATLDPVSRMELIGMLQTLCREEGRTIIIVTHRMDELLEAADRWVLLHKGECAFQGTPRELAGRVEVMEECGMAVPLPLRCWSILSERFNLGHEEPCFTAESLAERIAALRNTKAEMFTANTGEE
ncbi:energy-coupling factor transport system ATP-binding protein [Paenibacillus uliginis N3/975]|uniref:Energy-coupling factor transport system ATP-binding protein n=1 Tax=Paenibacillus uliginis N3/975 TaxID=1313296 RepID=A0A1X7HQX4_9BACL|nr:energy-coupling factor transporter ATPase [Paenibacillus uliginis]SMF91140.1 energy-coupling factor transport system ATP-binding protein [Paenibacillus uliginis N3/975]